MEKEKIVTDVLCIGGGIAGLMAAIRACELGADVIVVEKGNTLRSGAGATGNDHFQCYIPEYHGPDIRSILEELNFSQIGFTLPLGRVNFPRTWLENSFDVVRLWDRWGIPMKYNGEYHFAGHTYPGRVPTYLKYAGENQKVVLTKQARKAGAKILNRVSILDLLAGRDIHGALGIHSRKKKLIEFHAKAVILGTGSCKRLYPGPTPAWMSNLSHPFSNSGDGRAMAYRAGAELVSMEVLGRHAGPKYFARCGQATWVGVLKDAYGNPVGPFLSKPDKRYGDMTTELKKTLFEDYARSGKGPVYMDCSGISDEDYEYMLYWLKQEGNTALLNHMKEEGIDPRKTPIEWMTYELKFGFPVSGLFVNEKAETSMKGLYAAGDESFGGISGAAVFGWIAGENAAKYSRAIEGGKPEGFEEEVDRKGALLEEILSRENGADWKEVNIALQQLMYDYAGYARSETMLKAGLAHLKRLKEKAGKLIKAGNQHELMRCLEVFNLMDVGEAVFLSARERKESRGMHARPDYPLTNPLLGKLLIIRQEDSKPVFEWREIGA